MNKVVTHVAVGVAGVGIGFGVGYLIAKKRTERVDHDKIATINKYWNDKFSEEIETNTDLVEGDEIRIEEETYTIISRVDHASELEDEIAALEPDFPVYFEEAPVEVSDEFTVEGQAPAVDAKAFVEQYAQRTTGEFGGVTFPGQVDVDTMDADAVDIPVRSVPDFTTVRDPHGPYVISIDEYMDPESDPPFTKVEMRWFEGDNVAIDSRDQIVPMSTIGQKNTTRFGEGTTDSDQVYIRNERLSVDIELTREPGLYVHEILGQDFAEKKKNPKMRESDDS